MCVSLCVCQLMFACFSSMFCMLLECSLSDLRSTVLGSHEPRVDPILMHAFVKCPLCNTPILTLFSHGHFRSFHRCTVFDFRANLYFSNCTNFAFSFSTILHLTHAVYFISRVAQAFIASDFGINNSFISHIHCCDRLVVIN